MRTRTRSLAARWWARSLVRDTTGSRLHARAVYDQGSPSHHPAVATVSEPTPHRRASRCRVAVTIDAICGTVAWWKASERGQRATLRAAPRPSRREPVSGCSNHHHHPANARADGTLPSMRLCREMNVWNSMVRFLGLRVGIVCGSNDGASRGVHEGAEGRTQRARECNEADDGFERGIGGVDLRWSVGRRHVRPGARTVRPSLRQRPTGWESNIKVMFYTGKECRDHQFPDGTSVIILVDSASSKISALAWVGGTYFDSRNAPLKTGTPVAEAVKVMDSRPRSSIRRCTSRGSRMGGACCRIGMTRRSGSRSESGPMRTASAGIRWIRSTRGIRHRFQVLLCRRRIATRRWRTFTN